MHNNARSQFFCLSAGDIWTLQGADPVVKAGVVAVAI